MSKWIEYQPVLDEIRHEWCNKCNKTCPYNNCKIYRVMQILRRQKAIPHENVTVFSEGANEEELRNIENELRKVLKTLRGNAE